MTAFHGHIERRLLVNALVDPDEAGARLPALLRPHIVAGGTVVGCCLLDLRRLRPAGVPERLGVSMRAAAHRISVEWDTPGGVEVGVFVPLRLTDSRLAAAVGGRLAPGVHRRAAFETTDSEFQMSIRVGEKGSPFFVDVEVSRGGCAAHGPVSGITADTCVAARIGLSPDRAGDLEGTVMDIDGVEAVAAPVSRCESSFLGSFSTVGETTALVMDDIDVGWERTHAPGSPGFPGTPGACVR